MSEPTKADLEKELEDLRAENAKLKAAPAKPASPWPESMILTRSEHAALTHEQQTEFRMKLGTVTEDADYGAKVAAEKKAQLAVDKARAEAAVNAALAKVAADALKK